MLDMTELRCLTRWCRERQLHWQPALCDDGTPALMLQSPARALPRMLLVSEDHAFCLLDDPGEVLAEASSLTALLDAVDAGVAEPPALFQVSRRASEWRSLAPAA